MARGSTARRVARAAATGGGRTSRGRAPVGWWATLALIVLLGLASVAWSRYERTHPVSPPPPTTHDHWKAAFAFDICGVAQPNPPASPNQPGDFTTSGNGIININPKSSSETGPNATLGRFVSEYPGMTLTASSVRYPGGRLYTNGQSCGSSPGKVEVKTWSSLADSTGQLVEGNPADLRLQNGQLITIGFVPAGKSLPKPASAAALTQASPSSTTAPAGSAPSASTPAGSATVPATSSPRPSSTAPPTTK
jgi:hypothetical protein